MKPFSEDLLIKKRLWEEEGELSRTAMNTGFYPGDFVFKYLVVVRNPAEVALTKASSYYLSVFFLFLAAAAAL